MHGEENAADPQSVQRLVELGVIEDRPGAATQILCADMAPPTEALSNPAPLPSWSLAFRAEVWLALKRARTQVNKVAFERLIERLRLRKAKEAPLKLRDTQLLKTIAGRFGRARLSAPIDPICLQDSLALLEVLARRRLYPDLVIGVNTAPFQAHCWVQAGPLVLNEPLDRVTAFQPILVV